MDELPTTTTEMGYLCVDLLPPFASVSEEDEQAIRVDANGDNRGAVIYWDRDGWAYRGPGWIGSGRIEDREDLAWVLCDVLGIQRPARRDLRDLAHEAGAAGDHELQVMALNAIEGDARSIMHCAQLMAEVAERATG